jgi:hypothetical protein
MVHVLLYPVGPMSASHAKFSVTYITNTYTIYFMVVDKTWELSYVEVVEQDLGMLLLWSGGTRRGNLVAWKSWNNTWELTYLGVVERDLKTYFEVLEQDEGT